MKPPVAPRVEYKRHLHGHTWTDHYHWLRAENWQACIEDPSALPEPIRQYLEAENAWFEQNMADTAALQAQLVAEMRGRMQDVDQSLPDEKDGWCYVERYEADDEYPRLLRYRLAEGMPDQQSASAGASERQQLLIDFNSEAVQHDYFDHGDYAVSPAHTHLAWAADSTGSERYTLRVRNLATGIDEDKIDDVSAAIWGDSQHLFYTRLNTEHRPDRVYRHRLGTPCINDELVFEESDPRFHCSVFNSASEEYVFISTATDDQTEYWYIPRSNIGASPVIIEPRCDGVEYDVEHQGERFLILTNADNAQDFKIVTTACDTPGRAHWQDWLAHRPGIMLLDVFACDQWIMWMERENALPRICYCHATQNADARRTLAFDQEAYALSLEPLVEFHQSAFRFSFESPSTPEQTYLFNMNSGTRELLKQEVLPSGHNSDNYIVRRVFAPAKDGESVPVTLLYRTNTRLDGTAPCLLSAYGAYGASSPAVFSGSLLSLIDRGFIHALAHVRGGQEKGRAWYDAARGLDKQNTFDDVVSAAHYLINETYIGSGKIVLSGASAGGLVVGAVLNQTEHLWAGAIAAVPFVDALNSLIDDTLPLTPGEWSQWGNPLADAEAFAAIRRYSPYDNVQQRAYPPILVTAGVSDSRVTYWEPAKWVAQHRHQRHDDTLLLLRTNLNTGHFGASGRYASLQDEAIEQAFALKVVGLD